MRRGISGADGAGRRVLILGAVLLALAPLSAMAEEPAPRIVNIVNFIRQNEPRIAAYTPDVLYQCVVEQVAILKRYGLKGTFLLQYDALIDPHYQKLLKELPPEQFEIGAWWEIPQPLVEDSGYKWRGRYPWDWNADVGFATGYTPAEREKLVDTYMAEFKKVFGRTPASVGSWFIDAHTLRYMSEKYGVVASCNCKDQIGTDGYTLWGGYWNQGYYPSLKNAYMPAQNAENQIPVPIFRMLGSDPIHQYDSGLGSDTQHVVSLEPVYQGGGGNVDWCNWYFDNFVSGAAIAYGYVQAGQENSFTWPRMQKGFEIQMPLIASLAKEGKVSVQTLEETGRWFRQRFPVTPPTSVVALSDDSEKNQKSVWFNSRFFRANLLWEKGTVRFRDIHLFDERVASDYVDKKGTSTQCFYATLPLVDGFVWSSDTKVAGLRVVAADGREIVGGDPSVDDATPGVLKVRWPTTTPKGELAFTFDERTLTVAGEGLPDGWFLELTTAEGARLPFAQVEPKRLTCKFRGAAYRIEAVRGSFRAGRGAALRIVPEAGRIALDCAAR
ncbi:MAG: hypothetical protein H6534_06130 [Chthonomonadaceae bacterium]|nr:hypothetical protein [Chthonomonadaceae bacterium]